MHRRPFDVRFWSRIDITPGCWLWTGGKEVGGYGVMLEGPRNGKLLRVHLVSWRLHNGEIPEGMRVLHRCDVRHCANPDHLFLGTHADNMADMVAKGRQARGSAVGQSKLSELQVLAIRDAHGKGASQHSLARKYGVTKRAITCVVRRLVWRHI